MNPKDKFVLPKSVKPGDVIDNDPQLSALRDRLKVEADNLQRQKHHPKAERAQLINDRLHVPRPKGSGELIPDKDYEGSLIPVYVMQIKPYDRNPRREKNPKFGEIKESIRTMGLQSVFGVTRRPGEEEYMVAGGGNTRLQAMQELYQEGDSRFEMISCRFVPWKSEAAALAWHVGENEQRADISFWDKANALMSLKEVLESQKGHEITVRQLEAECRQLGLRMSAANITVYRFAVERLGALNYRLTNLATKRLQPHYNALRRLAARFGIAEAVFTAEIVVPATARVAEDLDAVRLADDDATEDAAGEGTSAALDVQRLMREWEVSLESRLDAGMPVTQLLAALERQPEATKEQLIKPAKAPLRHPEIVAPAKLTESGAQQAGTGRVERAPVLSPPDAGPPLASEESADAAPSTSWPGAIDGFARLVGLAEHLRPCPGLSYGFYIEAPSGEIGAVAALGWLMLARISGQMRLSGARLLPEGSRFRRAMLMEAGLDDTAFPSLIEDDLLATPLGFRGRSEDDEADVAVSLIDLMTLLSDSQLRLATLTLLDVVVAGTSLVPVTPTKGTR